MLADEDLRRRVASDAHGPRIGAVGHSAGGYTVLALAGGKHSPDRLNRHCREHGGDDPIFCGVGRRTEAASAPRDEPGAAPIADARIRAVVALSPVGAVFDAVSLRRVDVPIAVWSADLDRFLVPRFHAEWIAQNLPATSLRRVPNAWHFAFMDTPSFNIPSPDGDIAADPDGFDRARFLDQLGPALATFFDESFAARSGRR